VEEAMDRRALFVEAARKSVQLSESEEKFRLLFETSEDAILLFAEGSWIDCNESVECFWLLSGADHRRESGQILTSKAARRAVFGRGGRQTDRSCLHLGTAVL